MKRTIWMLLTALALTACDKEDNEGAMPADGRIEIVTGVEALTRAPQLDDTGAGNFRRPQTRRIIPPRIGQVGHLPNINGSAAAGSKTSLRASL